MACSCLSLDKKLKDKWTAVYAVRLKEMGRAQALIWATKQYGRVNERKIRERARALAATL